MTNQRTPDIIVDFRSADGDRLVLNTIDARTVTLVRDKFTFIGTKAFSGTVGEVRYEIRDGDALVMGDVNGDKSPDFLIHLENVRSLSASDFIL